MCVLPWMTGVQYTWQPRILKTARRCWRKCGARRQYDGPESSSSREWLSLDHSGNESSTEDYSWNIAESCNKSRSIGYDDNDLLALFFLGRWWWCKLKQSSPKSVVQLMAWFGLRDKKIIHRRLTRKANASKVRSVGSSFLSRCCFLDFLLNARRRPYRPA